MDQLPRPVPARRGLCNKSLRGAKPRNLLVEQRALGLWWRHVKAAMASMSKSCGPSKPKPIPWRGLPLVATTS